MCSFGWHGHVVQLFICHVRPAVRADLYSASSLGFWVSTTGRVGALHSRYLSLLAGWLAGRRLVCLRRSERARMQHDDDPGLIPKIPGSKIPHSKHASVNSKNPGTWQKKPHSKHAGVHKSAGFLPVTFQSCNQYPEPEEISMTRVPKARRWGFAKGPAMEHRVSATRWWDRWTWGLPICTT